MPPQYERWYGASDLEKGDWISSARNVSQLDVSRHLKNYKMRAVWSWPHEFWIPLRTANPDAGASFYSHHGGYVPFAWKDVPLDTIGLGRVTRVKSTGALLR